MSWTVEINQLSLVIFSLKMLLYEHFQCYVYDACKISYCLNTGQKCSYTNLLLIIYQRWSALVEIYVNFNGPIGKCLNIVYRETTKQVGFLTVSFCNFKDLILYQWVYHSIFLYIFQSFYKGSFTRDENRVNKLFQEAESRGITLEKRFAVILKLINHQTQRVT